VDVPAAFDTSQRLSLLDVIHIQNHIASLLGAPVDLIEEGTLKHRVQAAVEREAVRAFQRSSPPPQDILESIERIERFSRGMDFSAFSANEQVVYALIVEKELTTLKAAVAKALNEISRQHGNPD